MSILSFSYDSNFDPAAPLIEIGVSYLNNHDNQESLSALLDSGADATMLPINVLTKVGARYLETRFMRGATGHRIEVDTYLVSIHIGAFTISGIQAVAMREGIESIVGRDVMNQLEITLNGPANVVEVLIK